MASFFEHQDRAQSRTGWLVALFLFGMCGVVGAITGVAAVVQPTAWPYGTLIGVCIVGIPYLFKALTLSGSGHGVAQSLGCTRIDPGSQDPSERKVLNVVEEMAIASGMPVPPVYVMEDPSINAFAAGTTPQNAAIGVSRGAIESLTRDELQGVMAHEFSHIFHGDMRINIRAVAAIFGVMAVGLIGQILLRMGASSRRKKDAGGVIVVAIALIVIGAIGTFFARLMQAAISRQREFLADASAVQYTRNPAGIAGALRKIASEYGSAVSAPQASQFNHMFFASGFNALFASHPPLEVRIARIEAIAGGVLPPASVPTTATEPIAAPAAPSTSQPMASISPMRPMPGNLAASVAAIGSVPSGSLQAVHSAFDEAAPEIERAIHDQAGARALVLAVCMQSDVDLSERQCALIRARLPEVLGTVRRLMPLLAPFGTQHRMAMVDVACATLVLLDPTSYGAFRSLLADVVRVDGKTTLFEWVVLQVLRMRVELPMSLKAGEVARKNDANLAALAVPATRLLGVLALQGHPDEQSATGSFQAGLAALGFRSGELPPRDQRTLDTVAQDLDVISMLRPAAAGQYINAAFACVSHDAETTDREYLLLRALSERLGVPLPPMIAA
ncbi:MAG: hypothetical protein EBR10_03985 [Planctomycetes bacterium]|nr:hypothetical protein [Planctomycetota bacterium]